MKNNLFLTTAIAAATFIALPAKAEIITERVVVPTGETGTVSENLTNFVNLLTGGAAQNSGTLNVDDEISFEGNTAHAGGAIYSTGTLNIGNNVSFINNTTAEGQDAGAALYAMGGETATNVVIGDGVNFDQNTSNQKAGAIFLEDANLTIGDNAKFKNNSSVANAGVIYNWDYLAGNSKTVIGKNAIFEGNTAGTHGGVIANYDGDVKIGTTATFDSNHADNGYGGAIFNNNYLGTSKLAIDDNVSFVNNTAFQGGAIFNNGEIQIGKNSLFENNTAVNSGAIHSSGKLTIGDASKFTNNKSENYAGAILFQNGDTMTIGNDVEFSGNESGTSGDKHSAGAIAIEDQGDTNANVKAILGNNVKFTANKATNSAGALYMYESAGKLSLSVGDDATFSSNAAGKNGGAIAVYGATNGVEVGKNALFESNEASVNGGALYLSDWGDDHKANMTFAEGVKFTDNKAGTLGGAIYNAGTLTFNGAAVFSGNTDSTGANDIYNTGTITFNGDVTLDGGISGDTGTTIFANGSKLTVKANETKIANIVKNDGATLNLNLDNGFTGTYEMVLDGNTNLDNEFTIAENTLYNINTTDTKGTYDVSKKSGAEVAAETGATQNQAAAVTAITNGDGNNATFNAIAENISDLMQSGGAMGVQLALDAAETLAPEAAPVVLQTATENVGQIFSAVSARLSGGGAATASNSQGMSSGDSVFENGAVWVQGLYNHAKLNDTRKAKGYKADSNGLAFGFEKQINDNVKAGIGYAYTKTDVDGHNRDLDIDTHTALVYGEYKPSAWFVNAMASYSWSDYDEDKKVLGRKITGDYDAQSYALQAMTGYELGCDNTIFTPEAGLRYIHVSQDGYKDKAGQYVYGSEVDTLTGVAGLRVEQAYALDNGWTLRPSARFAVTYDIANDDGNSAALLANGTAYTVKGEAMDRFGMEADFALTADITDNASVSLGYQGKFRDDYKDHTGLLNLKYNF